MEVRPRSRTRCSGRLELRLGDPMESEFDRKVAAERAAGRAGPRPGAGQAALHGRAAAHRRSSSSAADLVGRHGGLRRGGEVQLAGPSAPAVRLLPRQLPADQLPKGFEFPDRGIAIGIDETDAGAGVRRLRDRPVLPDVRRERVGQDRAAAAASPSRSPSATPRTRRRSSSATTGAPCSGALPESHLLEYAPMASSMQMHMEALAGVLSRRQPARTSRRSSCATAAGGPVRRSSSSSTTTTWWRRTRATRSPRSRSTCRSPGTSGVRVHHRAQLGGGLAIAVRVVHAAHQGARARRAWCCPAIRPRAI